MELQRHQIAIVSSLPFMLAGNSTFTVKSIKSQKHFTYHVEASEKGGDFYFVSVLTGQEKDYLYIGYIRYGRFVYGHKSKLKATDPKVLAFEMMFNLAANQRNNVNAELYHEGRCGMCGRPLTHPQSLQTGIGPDCATRMR